MGDSPEKTKERNDEQMQKLRAEKGITLIALVITIVLNCCRSGRYEESIA